MNSEMFEALDEEAAMLRELLRQVYHEWLTGDLTTGEAIRTQAATRARLVEIYELMVEAPEDLD